MYIYYINMNGAAAAAEHLIRKIYPSFIDGTARSYHAYLFQSSNWISTLTFQICHQTTLRDDTTSHPWSIYPTAKSCVDVPWWNWEFVLLAVCSLMTTSVLLLVTAWIF